MTPELTGQRYNQIAKWWQDQHQNSVYGIPQFKKAISFVKNREKFLDVGCGSSGRLIKVALECGFNAEGMDVSQEMIRLAQELHPEVKFYNEDVCTWNPPLKYDLICAWDSIFHLPINQHELVLAKLCNSLSRAGVILFTCGPERGEVSGVFQEQSFEYSSLGVQAFLELLGIFNCQIKHLENDQYPESHVYIIAQKK